MARRWGDPVRVITEAELLYPETALAIAVLETGGFRSRRMMKSHNWFGFRRNRRTHQQGIVNGYGVYANAQAMLADYGEWEGQVTGQYHLDDEQAFRAWIARHYAEDPRYGQKLTTILAGLAKSWR